jgi:hypothetical protein
MQKVYVDFLGGITVIFIMGLVIKLFEVSLELSAETVILLLKSLINGIELKDLILLIDEIDDTLFL